MGRFSALFLAPGTNPHTRHIRTAILATVVALLGSVLGVACTGDPSEHLTFIEIHRDGEGGVYGLNGATAVTVSPDGRHVYATAGVTK